MEAVVGEGGEEVAVGVGEVGVEVDPGDAEVGGAELEEVVDLADGVFFAVEAVVALEGLVDGQQRLEVDAGGG